MRFLAMLSFCLSLLLVGCSEAPRTQGGVPYDKNIHSIVSLSPSTTEIVANCVPLIPLSGRTAACNFPVQILEKVPIVAQVKPNYEKIASIKPSLIVYDGSLYSTADIDKLKSLNIPLYEFKSQTIDAFIDELRKLGAQTVAETEISAYCDKILEERTSSQSEVTTHPKVAVIIGSNGRYMIEGTKGFTADVVRAAGGEPVGPDSERFETLNPEVLISMNPDFVFLGTSDKGSETEIAGFRNDPRLKTLKAIGANHVYGVKEDILVRRGARVDMLIDGINRGIKGK